MARPEREERETIRYIMLTLKLAPVDQARLDELVRLREAEVMTPMNKSSLIRWLIAKEAAARGIEPSPESMPPSKPKKSRARKR